MTHNTLETHRLSPQQRHLWLLSNGKDEPYHSRILVRIDGPLNSALLRRALDHLEEKHSILRTDFLRSSGLTVPLQSIRETRGLALTEIDVSDRILQEKQATLDQLFEKGKPSAATQADEGCVTLVKWGEECHFLFMSINALCSDDPGLLVLIGQLSTYLNDDANTGHAERPLQYSALAEWQNNLLEDETRKEGPAFWRTQLAGHQTMDKLPFFNPSATAMPFALASHRQSLDATLLQSLQTLALQWDTDLETLLFGCTAATLWRLSRQPDRVVGFAADGRGLEELAEVPGLFAKNLPIRLDLTDQTTVDELVQSVDSLIAEAYDWEGYFDWDLMDLDRPSDDRPFFPCVFQCHPEPEPVKSGPLAFKVMRQFSCWDRFDLRIAWQPMKGALYLDIDYHKHHFERTDMEQLAESISGMAKAFSQKSNPRIGALPLLEPSRNFMLSLCCGTVLSFADRPHIHQQISEFAMRFPNDIALRFENETLSWAELEHKSNQIMTFLLQGGVGSDTPVGLFLERSLEMMVALVAILKTGGYFIPLDPATPKHRLAFMLRDTGIQTALTQSSLRGALQDSGIDAISVDSPPGTVTPLKNLPCGRDPETAAYLIFTSGSTGKPKGVLVTHGAVNNYRFGFLERTGLPLGTSFASVSTLMADLGNTAIFGAFTLGGTLHIISRERSVSPSAMAAYSRKYPFDCLKIVPSHLAALLPFLQDTGILPRKLLVLGGETTSSQLLESLAERAPRLTIVNHYGPTETTVGVLTHVLDLRSPSDKVPPLGKPMANNRVFVMDPNLHLVPLNIAGELTLGGPNLARGYLRAPAKTASRFVPDPYSTTPGARLYRTGDRGRLDRNGNFFFLGRVDSQIKIHGFRVELGEIETRIAEGDDVADCLVLPRKAPGKEQRLVAYVVPKEGQKAPSLETVRARLKGYLPDYMAPQALLALDRFPLTANGKIDREALPHAEPIAKAQARPYHPPRNQVETTLAKIWTKVLQTEPIGIHDNFFELGGDSILAIRVVARANQEGLGLEPKQILDAQTIAQLASLARRASTPTRDTPAGSGPIPLTPIQHWFFEQDLAEMHHWNQTFLMELPTRCEPRNIWLASTLVMARHDAFGLRFTKGPDGYQQKLENEENEPAFLHIDLSALQQKQKSSAIEAASQTLQASLNLESGPLARVACFTLGKGYPARMLWMVHHLAVDGLSWRILHQQFWETYDALGRDSRQLPKPEGSSFWPWAEALPKFAQSQSTVSEVEYWTASISRVQSCIPLDGPGKTNLRGAAQTLSQSLNSKHTSALFKDLLKAYNATPQHAVLTALAMAFTQKFNLPGLLLEMEGHGREPFPGGPDPSSIVGWFTSRYPLYLEPGDGRDCGQSLMEIKEQCAKVPNNGFGYGLLRYLGKPTTRKQLNKLPKPQVSFNFLGQFGEVESGDRFKPAEEAAGPSRSPAGQRTHLIDINVFVSKNILTMGWRFNPNLHQAKTVENLAVSCVRHLEAIVDHCTNQRDRAYTPSDFPMAGLNQKKLDKVLKRLKRR